MRSLHSSSGQGSPLGMESSTIRCGREEENKKCPSWMRSLRSSSGQSSPLGTESSTIRYEREEKNRVCHGWEVCSTLLVIVLYRERRVPLSGTKEKRRTESVMDEKLALLFWSEFSIGNREFRYQVWKVRGEQWLSWIGLLFWSEFH